MARAAVLRVARRMAVTAAPAHPELRNLATSTSSFSPPRPVGEEHVIKAIKRDRETTESYERLDLGDPETTLIARRKRLVYRARQRGWLEVDLILGTFAHARVPAMDERELDEFEDVLRLDTADVYNWVLGREPIPAERESSVFRSLIEFAMSSPVGQADPQRYAEVKPMMSN
ncbi:hypothetical protein FNF28_00371 [Cafeteria roenbergensis]|uniref:SDH assembly factor 2 n=1 Tax=Cafeteria roenbergensis TaxID=33653 RepID=A0A5A8E4T3_CAFRO|nr:hypothetical protein FNF28_00371 [Cafeteria roenbergensis]